MRLILFFFFSSFTFSTEKAPEKCYESFQNWFKANHDQLVVKTSNENLSFEMSYLPNELIIFQQLFKAKDYSKKQINSLYSIYNSYDEYSFKISTLDAKDVLISQSIDKIEYQEKQFYLIESVIQDFYLIRNQDTLQPIQCQFENNYGTAPFITLHLVFEKAPKMKIEKLEIVYSDQLFQSNAMSFDFTHIQNLKIPKIK